MKHEPMATLRYELVLQSASDEPGTALTSIADPDEATMAFHAAVRDLLERRVGGELQLFKDHRHDRVLLLRQPLRRSPDSPIQV